jgi:hypothetical protein
MHINSFNVFQRWLVMGGAALASLTLFSMQLALKTLTRRRTADPDATGLCGFLTRFGAIKWSTMFAQATIAGDPHPTSHPERGAACAQTLVARPRP